MRNNYRFPISLLVITLALGAFAGCSDTTPPPQPTPTPYEVPYISADLDKAREALFQFFSLLQAGRYDEAIAYYGGDYDVLRDWNPNVPADDYAQLFENGCTVNGLQCLAIRTVDPGVELEGGMYRFMVDFAAPDGSAFGAERQFTYTVKQVDGKFLVQELPVYVP
jgi:hypothetical protein